MHIGVPKEIKDSEYRVGLTEINVKDLVQKGHKVFVQKGAGEGSQILDQSYQEAGATLLDSLPEIYKVSDMVVKVKEPLAQEYELFKKDQILFTFLHLAAEPELTEVLCQKQVKAVAYETIKNSKGELPLLIPMSQVAGRVGFQNGAYYFQKHMGGQGILPGGIAGVEQAQVLILGGGTAGTHAAMMAVGVEAQVTFLDIHQERLDQLQQLFKGQVRTLISNKDTIISELKKTDLLISSVLLTGERAPKLITEDMIRLMKKNSVVVDISIDQGGCIETAHPTSHQKPTYKVHDVIHYCVPNIPSSVSRTSTYALTHISFPFVLEIANKGLEKALKENKELQKGLNTYKGHITCLPVAKSFNKTKTYKPFEELVL